MAIDSFLAMLATGFCQLLCLRSERGQPMWLLGTSSQRYEQTSSLKKTTYPNVKGYYWTSLVNHMINTNYVYSIYIYTYQYNMYIIYIYINSYCSSRHLYKYCYSNSLPIFSWMPLIAVCTIKKHVAQCHARSGRQVPDRLLSVPIWHFTPESSHNNLVCLIVRV
jgi:hypothetical protein